MLMYGLPGNIDYPSSTATSVQVVFDPTYVGRYKTRLSLYSTPRAPGRSPISSASHSLHLLLVRWVWPSKESLVASAGQKKPFSRQLLASSTAASLHRTSTHWLFSIPPARCPLHLLPVMDCVSHSTLG